MSDDIQTLRSQLLQLKSLHETGALDAAQYEQSRAKLERRLVDAVLSGAPLAAGAAVAAASGSPPTAAPAAQARPPLKLLGMLAAGVVVLAAAGYWWTGAPSRSAEAVASAEDAASGADGAPHALSFEQVAAMADKLAQRLKTQPEDADGWAMLARSYNVLGRTADAVPAYQRAVALRGDDATLLADYADALATQNKRSLSGEPMKLVARALKIDPNNVKALALAGTEAFDRKDYASAVKQWDKAIAVGPADDAVVQQLSSSVAEARELGKLPPAPAAASAPSLAAPSGGSVSGSVSLAPALRKQADANDTVFVFARAVNGPPMPLAVLRKQVKDLPLAFTLDDSMAMSPAAKISGAGQVIVSARISKSGNAISQSGDLQGQSAAVAVGAGDLKIEINSVVKK